MRYCFLNDLTCKNINDFVLYAYQTFTPTIVKLVCLYDGYDFLHICELTRSRNWQMKRRPRLTPEMEALALFDELGAGSVADTDRMRLLVDLFYECTSSDPADRPTAQCIYDKLSEVTEQLDATQIGSSSSS